MIKNNPVLSRHIVKLFSFVMLAACLMACNRKIAFITSSVVPGAEGTVKVKKDNNGNNAVEIKVVNLADPQQLSIPQNTYVVWMESSDGIKNIGQIRSSAGLLSSTRKGELETITPFKPTRIFITGESDGNVQYPGNVVVLSTRSF
jgi:hypothetical protein